MGHLQQTQAAGKSPGAKIGPDAEGDHRQLVEDRHLQRLIDLLRCQELRLVNQDTGGHRSFNAGLLYLCRNRCAQIVVRGQYDMGRTRYTQAGHDLVVALGIHRGFDQHH